MELTIRPVREDDVEAVVQLSLLAWVPIFDSFRRILGPTIYALIWPNWTSSQRAAIEAVCREPSKTTVLVAEFQARVVGFIAYELDAKDLVAEVQLLAVHPDYQNRGIGTELNAFALTEMTQAGMRMAKVETGGDTSHAPARRSYEKTGYTGLPLVRYFKNL